MEVTFWVWEGRCDKVVEWLQKMGVKAELADERRGLVFRGRTGTVGSVHQTYPPPLNLWQIGLAVFGMATTSVPEFREAWELVKDEWKRRSRASGGG